MAYDGFKYINGCRRGTRRNPVSKHKMQPEYGDEQADAGRDYRTHLAMLRRGRGRRNIHFPCSADHEQDWQPYPVDPYSCYMCDHTWAGVFFHITPAFSLPPPPSPVPPSNPFLFGRWYTRTFVFYTRRSIGVDDRLVSCKEMFDCVCR